MGNLRSIVGQADSSVSRARSKNERGKISRSILLAISVLTILSSMEVACFGPKGPVEDFIEIVDIPSGEKVSLPYRADILNRESFALDDPEGERFFTIRALEAGSATLRTISYSGQVLAEKELPEIYNNGDACAVSPDRAFVAECVYGRDGISLCDVGSGSVRRIALDLPSTIVYVAWIGDRQLLLVTGRDSKGSPEYTSAVLSLNTDTEAKEVLYQDDGLTSHSAVTCVLSPDKRMLAYFSDDTRNIKVLDLDAREAHVIAGEMAVKPLKWSPDSAHLAYYLPASGLFKAYSVKERKEAVAKPWGELGGGWIPNLYFLDSRRVALEVGEIITASGPSGISKSELVTVDVTTGAVERPLTWKVRGRGHPIASGKKLVCFVDDDRDYFSR